MTSAEQTEAIKKTMQDEKCGKDEVIRELVDALNDCAGWIRRYHFEDRPDLLVNAGAALRKAGAL
ncbi:hypothetical protein V5F49_20300 [Xanthobacter sp. V3C-3]|uniref:hypothetical protein n=1 Tax=Xanthobacter lutulentifluminis TaxID=3119935 RepID=UPI00372B2777